MKLPVGIKKKCNEWYLHEYRLTDLAKTYGTPLYIYDKEQILTKIAAFNGAFIGSQFTSQIVYASKAFLVPKILDVVKTHNWMVDAVSLGDLYLINKSGFPLEQVIFHGNNKSLSELTYAIKNNVGVIVVDNFQELQDIVKLAKDMQKMVNTMFRVNPGIEAHTHCYIQTSLVSSKFGESIYDDKVIELVMKEYLKSDFVKLLGFHSHIGSQITDEKAFLANIDAMVNFTKAIETKYQYPLTELNLGGGFGICYTDEPVDLNHILRAMATKLDEILVDSNINKVYLEPGRSVVGDAGVTLYQIDYLKHTFGGKNYLFVDGGMTDNIRPALYHAEYSAINLNKDASAPLIKTDIVGKCCESGDIIVRDAMMPVPTRGDIMMILATGAYCYSMSLNYNGATKAAVILVGNDVEVISRREELNDLMKLFK